MTTDTFVAACAAAMAGGDREAALGQLYRSPRARAIFVSIGRKHRLTEADIEELRQRVALLFHSKLLDTLREPEGVYPVLYAAGKHVALKLATKQREASLEALAAGSNVGNVGDFLELLIAPGVDEPTLEDDVVGGLSKQQAKEQFAMRLAAHGVKGVLQTKVADGGEEEEPVPGKRRRKRVGYSTAQLRLREIRQSLKWTLPEFAIRLDLPESKLHAMLYGLGTRVPSDLIRTAEDLLLTTGESRHEETHRFQTTPMKEIVIQWMRALGILSSAKEEPEEGDLSKLANALGVNRSTCWRWFVENNKPRLATLARYDALVSKCVTETRKSRNTMGDKRMAAQPI